MMRWWENRLTLWRVGEGRVVVVDRIVRKEFLRIVEAEVLEVRMGFEDMVCVQSVVDHGMGVQIDKFHKVSSCG